MSCCVGDNWRWPWCQPHTPLTVGSNCSVYDDVAPAMRRLREGGAQLYIYSSGSIEAQKLIFGFSCAGDLTQVRGASIGNIRGVAEIFRHRQYLSGYFDTTSGQKRDSSSYTRIASSIGVPADAVLFLSDRIEGEFRDVG